MGRARRTWALQLPLVVIVALCGCGGGGGGGSGTSSGPSAPSATADDINPLPRSEVADGGTLRWPIAQIPPNFNVNELDGTLADNAAIVGAMIPSPFNFDAASNPILRTEYVESARLTSTTPKQVVTYELNPKAVWYDGTPITETDYEAQWKALRGTDQRYQVASTVGYDQIESVAKGRDDHEVVVTFSTPYADWRGLFGALYPASTNSDPTAFNTGWKAMPLTSAGPFRLGGIDQTAKTITLIRNEKWWGNPAKLDKIIYRAIDTNAQVDALANGEIDFMDVGPDVNRLQRSASTPGISIRRAGGPNFRHITFNGSGAILSDVNVRRAVGLAIDRTTIARALLGPLGLAPRELNNHIYMENQKGYQNNAGDLATYQPQKAASLLEAAGWKLSGTQRIKDGKPLVLRLVIPSQVSTSTQESELIQSMLGRVGITVNIQTVPTNDFFDKYITPGDFDLTLFSWLGGDFPISGARSIYAKPSPTLGIQQNYARIGSDQIDALFKQATAEFDPAKAIVLGNRIDALIWQEVHSLTLYQRPDIAATKATLANFGAFGFAGAVYEDIGFRKA